MNDWYEAEQRAERAQQLCESRRFKEALAELDAALAINPNNPAWLAQRGVLLEELDRLPDAAEAYERALSLETGDSDIGLALGSVLVRLGRFAEALEVFDDLSREHPDLEPAYCYRIQIYTELGQHDRAEQMFYLAQQLDDACPDCFFHIGISLAARGQANRSLFCWHRVLKLEPDYPGVNERIAQAYRSRGDMERAREYLLRELRTEPGDTDLLFQLAGVALEAGQLNEAAAKLRQIIELEPDLVDAHTALGKLRLTMGQPEEAVRCFEAANAANDDGPQRPELRLNWARALSQLSRWSEARGHLEVVLEHRPLDTNATVLFGDCLFAEGHIQNASLWYRRVLAGDAANPLAHQKLSLCDLRRGRYDSALKHCLAILKSSADDAPATYNAAVALLSLGRWSEGRKMLDRASRLSCDAGAVYELRRRIWRMRVSRAFRRILRLLGRTS
jgi:tetratricopeptide (TPR) repeat protein